MPRSAHWGDVDAIKPAFPQATGAPEGIRDKKSGGQIGRRETGFGSSRDVRWLVIPSVVLPFLFQHATQGWCPPVPFFRAKGIRTRGEIDREIYALKALRGDFNSVESADAAWSAAGPSTSPLLS